MMKSKWMIGLVPLLLAVAPAALADESNDTSSQAVLTAAGQSPAASEPPTADPTTQDEQALRELNAEVKALRAALARQSEDGRSYLPQSGNPWR